ncbi:uncharacterized protein [Typha latifolia]|uniref:uncharacterized protein n=1 Tax=Typha latifolia TaxID=4733 RepID=UPI003C2CEE1B
MAAKLRRQSNLETFLARATPSVPSYAIPKTCFRDPNSLWQLDGKDLVQCFILEDLWDQYAECSAYGLGVPICLSSGEIVVQYFVPYLSALQIYTGRAHTISRTGCEESESDSWSDDSTSEKLSRSWDAISEDSIYDLDTSFLPRERFGHLYFDFVEQDSPYRRLPLFDKVNELARGYPGLTTLKSVELSPASWMSVAWYPIYHIPSHGNLRDMSTCFLTYHTLSSLFQDNTAMDMKDGMSDGIAYQAGRKIKQNKCVTLSPFGLASYRMLETLWNNPETSDDRRICTLYSAADSWLKQLGVYHHDFNFFRTHSM